MPTIFKKCPMCGRRFEVEHTGESVEKKTDVVMEEKVISPPSIMATNSLTPLPLPNPPAANLPVVMVPELIEEDDYTETYKCKHCGHVWTEKREVVEDLGQAKGAVTDH